MKGLVKIKNFKKNPNKIHYIYILTPKGISRKAKLIYNFMQMICVCKNLRANIILKIELCNLRYHIICR